MVANLAVSDVDAGPVYSFDDMADGDNTLIYRNIITRSLVVLLMAQPLQVQAVVFHVLKGRVCTGASSCDVQTGECYKSGQIFEVNDSYKLVATKDAELGYQNRLGQTKYRKIDRCKNLSPQDLDTSHEKPLTLLETAESLITGQKVAFQGGKRLKSGTATLASMPQGDVLLTKAGILFPMTELSPKQVVKLQVIDAESDKTVLDLSRPKQPTLLNVKYFKAGTSYNWLVRTSDTTYQGMFRVMESEYQKEVESEVLAVLKDNQASPMGELMMRAAVYQEYGLSFDRDRILSEVRNMNERR